MSCNFFGKLHVLNNIMWQLYKSNSPSHPGFVVVTVCCCFCCCLFSGFFLKNRTNSVKSVFFVMCGHQSLCSVSSVVSSWLDNFLKCLEPVNLPVFAKVFLCVLGHASAPGRADGVSALAIACSAQSLKVSQRWEIRTLSGLSWDVRAMHMPVAS